MAVGKVAKRESPLTALEQQVLQLVKVQLRVSGKELGLVTSVLWAKRKEFCSVSRKV